MKIITFLVIIVGAVIEAREFTNEELFAFPKLFHLDDYRRCLSQRYGLYCMGTFHLTPIQEPHFIYDLIKEYSSNRHHYNRSLIHRGLCVSARCPEIVQEVKNTSVSVQQCMNKRALAQNFRATLNKLHYCHHYETVPERPDIPKLVFLYIVYGILFMNIVGTVYDLIGGKNKHLLSWSVISNWRQLISTEQNEKDPRLVCLRSTTGTRVILSFLILWAHTVYLYTMIYIQNPRDVEWSTTETPWIIIVSGTTVGQLYVIISSFLCAYNLLLNSAKKELNFSMMPKQIIRRFIRLTPTHLLIVGYCATWWIDLRDGPQWWGVVGEQRDICRRKFWAHTLLINNLIEPEHMCQLQSWFLALNLQMYVVSLIFTILLAPLRRRALPILLTLFGFACILTSILAYINNWRSVLIYLTPEILRTSFHGGLNLTPLYLSPIGNLPSCIIGSLVAHFQFELRDPKNIVQKLKWLAYPENWFAPVFIAWLAMGRYVMDTESDIIAAAFVGVERLVFCIVFAIVSIRILNVDSWLERLCSWPGWIPLSNISMATMMTHWAINLTITVSRHQLNTFSFWNIVVDVVATHVFTYVVAVPVTVLVESPMRRFFDSFVK